MTNRKRRLNLLLIEDSPRRLKLLRNELERSETRCRLHTVGAGRDSLAYLRQETPFEAAPKPDLVIFDFSQPGNRYLNLVEELSTAKEFSEIPFAVLTSPETETILDAKYKADGNVIMFSAIELAGFLQTMNSLRIDRFLNAVSLIANLGFVLIRAPAEFIDAAGPMPIARSA